MLAWVPVEASYPEAGTTSTARIPAGRRIVCGIVCRSGLRVSSAALSLPRGHHGRASQGPTSQPCAMEVLLGRSTLSRAATWYQTVRRVKVARADAPPCAAWVGITWVLAEEGKTAVFYSPPEVIPGLLQWDYSSAIKAPRAPPSIAPSVAAAHRTPQDGRPSGIPPDLPLCLCSSHCHPARQCLKKSALFWALLRC